LRVILYSIVFYFLFFGTLVFADFRELREVSLKKDEPKKLLIKYDSYERLFTFRWTLFVNESLVLLHSYDRVVGQNILYSDGGVKTIRQELKTRGIDKFNMPYILVMFKDYNYEKREAIFEVLLSDKNMLIEIEEVQN